MSTHLIRHSRFPFPALNIPRRQNSVATDTIYVDTPAIECGHIRAQFYYGTDSQICDICGMKTDKQCITSFENIIRQRRVMKRVLSDQAQVEISGRVLDLLRTMLLGAGTVNHMNNIKIMQKGNI